MHLAAYCQDIIYHMLAFSLRIGSLKNSIIDAFILDCFIPHVTHIIIITVAAKFGGYQEYKSMTSL